MNHRALAATACLSVTLLAGGWPLGAQGTDTATVFVAVTDKGGKPLKGLTAADFSVAEDGAAKQVMTVEPASGPPSVALLVDRFGGDPTFSILAVRGALDTMVKTLHAGHPDTEISVTTIDPAAVPQIPFTMSVVEIRKFIDRLPPGVEQSVLLEGIMAGSASMAKANNPRRAIVALVAGYKPEAGRIEIEVVARTLRDSRASLWVMEGRSSFGGGGVASATRDAALTELVPASGGARLSVGVGTALETQAKRLCETLASQYALTYAAPRISARKLAVAVGVKNAKVLAPTWIPR
jgi:hypothetical protein